MKNIKKKETVFDEVITLTGLKPIPENFSLKTNGRDYENIYISSHIPLTKNLKISSLSNTRIKLHILDYDFNFDIKANKGIDFNEMLGNEYYYNTELENYFMDDASQQLKEFKGYLVSTTNKTPIEQSNEATLTNEIPENQLK